MPSIRDFSTVFLVIPIHMEECLTPFFILPSRMSNKITQRNGE